MRRTSDYPCVPRHGLPEGCLNYLNRSFTVGAKGSQADAEAECARVGHMDPDARGNCLRCAARIDEPGEPPSEPWDGRATMNEQVAFVNAGKSFRGRDLPPTPDMDHDEIVAHNAT